MIPSQWDGLFKIICEIRIPIWSWTILILIQISSLVWQLSYLNSMNGTLLYDVAEIPTIYQYFHRLFFLLYEKYINLNIIKVLWGSLLSNDAGNVSFLKLRNSCTCYARTIWFNWHKKAKKYSRKDKI